MKTVCLICADPAAASDSIYLTDEVAKDERANLIGYFAAVTAMDAGIGHILETLDELGLAEDTLVVFTSDNGFSCGHHGFWGKGKRHIPTEHV